VLEAVRARATAGRWICAICAAPLVLQAAGVLSGRRVTAYPSVQKELRAGVVVSDRVVVDGRLITSQGPGTAFEFALAIVEQTQGAPAARAVREGLVL
jgi:4-methyl-5(b-hydroxyethyl)-thiazole monophosphate biosynthesis